MDHEITIVSAKEEHIEDACDIAIKAWTPIREVFRRDLGDELYEGFFTNWQKVKREATRKQLLSERGYVVLLDSKVVGFISYTANHEAKTGEICGNAVDSSCRGMGIGPKMYEFVFSKMREEGLLFAQVNTGLDDGHAPARRAYEKVGFEKNLPSVMYYKKL